MTQAEPGPRRAGCAQAALLFALDPVGLGGVVLRAQPGPARDRWLAPLRARLVDGPDAQAAAAASPRTGCSAGSTWRRRWRPARRAASAGVLAEADGGVVHAGHGGARRRPAHRRRRIGQALDTGDGWRCRPARFGLVRAGRGHRGRGARAACLLDRAAIHARPAMRWRAASPRGALARARAAARGGGRRRRDRGAVRAPRWPWASGPAGRRCWPCAWRAPPRRPWTGARGRRPRTSALAARLVLAPRATRLPAPSREPEAPEPPDPEPRAEARRSHPTSEAPSTTRGRRAGRPGAGGRGPRSPPGCWRCCRPTRPRVPRPGRAGAARRSAAAGGRPASRPGEPRDGLRLNLIATLRAAAPWQRLRGSAATRPGIQVRRGRFARHPPRAAAPRRRRSSWWMPAARWRSTGWRRPRGRSSCCWPTATSGATRWRCWRSGARRRSVLLPPTRSLVRAKRSLAGLPGGGGTPLAAGIEAGVCWPTPCGAGAGRRRWCC